MGTHKIIPGFYFTKANVYNFVVTCVEILTRDPLFEGRVKNYNSICCDNGMQPNLPPCLHLEDFI
jgi:hypothetical protein